MNQYTEILNSYLSQHPQKPSCGDIDSLLGSLQCCYYQRRSCDPKDIQEKFEDLETIMSKLSLSDNNRVYALTVSLCQAYQKNAFQEGLLVGMHLYHELTAHNT